MRENVWIVLVPTASVFVRMVGRVITARLLSVSIGLNARVMEIVNKLCITSPANVMTGLKGLVARPPIVLWSVLSDFEYNCATQFLQQTVNVAPIGLSPWRRCRYCVYHLPRLSRSMEWTYL